MRTAVRSLVPLTIAVDETGQTTMSHAEPSRLPRVFGKRGE
jgi:hypothetical protein